MLDLEGARAAAPAEVKRETKQSEGEVGLLIGN